MNQEVTDTATRMGLFNILYAFSQIFAGAGVCTMILLSWRFLFFPTQPPVSIAALQLCQPQNKNKSGVSHSKDTSSISTSVFLRSGFLWNTIKLSVPICHCTAQWLWKIRLAKFYIFFLIVHYSHENTKTNMIWSIVCAVKCYKYHRTDMFLPMINEHE